MGRGSGDADVFGFDELIREFDKMEKRYPNQADRLLAANGRAVLKRVKQLTPQGKTRKLRASWRLRPVKRFRGGQVAVVRIQSQAPHAHLVELGHEIVTGGRSRDSRGRSLNRVQRSARGVRGGGRVAGVEMLAQSMTDAEGRFNRSAEQMLDELTRGVEV